MPIIGQISSRNKEGFKGSGKIIWSACPECGKERWESLKDQNNMCGSCGSKHRTSSIWEKDEHRPDCGCIRCKPKDQSGSKNAQWKGGRRKHASGYIYVTVSDDDPMRIMAGRDPVVFEHRLVMARSIGRPLLPTENVHHKNGDKTDNRIENLELWTIAHSNGIRVDDEYHCPGCRCFEGK